MASLRKRLDALTAELAEANYWRHNYADAVKETAKELAAMTAARDLYREAMFVARAQQAK